MFSALNVFGILYIVAAIAVVVIVLVLAVLLCRLAIAARENQLATVRLRELQIERLLLDEE
ncbi:MULTISPECIES: hypothetical protein [Rathayibacter]|jgi:signal transduction histidine kinase|uniref:Uncharacterized protein n=2 Tax=Rathayibacter festucae TaxID=110937 RepID=A0A3Q9UZN9_9MICO|nr:MULTISPECIES: hypothetical protein [Rathayibacter]AZZ52988.1 hypothetical protein C1I64_13720 [Rathayibacter festucae DSM 15932]MCJ1671736.1 hypothetical protein [Rathayibacter sp. VKM Ac-2929]MCJ1684092.1 hypothetical protein [Rathayibacter sp. VKM Ac-2928]MCJ1686874.1 hypothetical protein [Rathayibacter sp. VKM Ac-2927]MCJ1701571.1 hypothetical protein [Rathayibacter festucae]